MRRPFDQGESPRSVSQNCYLASSRSGVGSPWTATDQPDFWLVGVPSRSDRPPPARTCPKRRPSSRAEPQALGGQMSATTQANSIRPFKVETSKEDLDDLR